MSTVGGVQYHGGRHLLLFEYRGEDIIIHVDIMSTVVQYRGTFCHHSLQCSLCCYSI